ncbi:MAG TPA: DUF2231 domain-containing protein [Candidatus Binatia bacterium]|nr:DUF2231 domain-containing protein [Candidatus Binatia bacterium]
MLDAVLPGAAHLQNLHPLVVHFPLALLPAAALLYLLAALTRRESLAWTGLWLLVLGTAAGAVAAATGLYAMEGVMVDPTVRERLLDVHERWMLGTTALALLLAAWALLARPAPRRGRVLFAVGLLVLLAVLTKGADYGGRLVYDYNAGGSACGQPIAFTR